MISFLGLTIMSTTTREAYRTLHNRAYLLHQTLWYTDDYCLPAAQEAIKKLDAELAEALSHAPASDIDAAS